MLFAVLQPRAARAAAVNANVLRLSFAFRSRDVSIGDLQAVSVKHHRHWASVSLRHAEGGVTVSGLTREDAQALGDSLENARTRWWRRALAPQIGLLRSIHDCLKQLADPPNYVRIADIRDLTRDAQAAAGGLVGRWPPSLSDTPEIRMLKDILDFLEAPDRAREKANEARIANELTRSRTLFDTIEAMPLTEEQRHAVVLDDHRNLVVAAAGSGKTSVIVAKAGWLIKRGYRRPSELLLLAFARDARHEMQQRIRKRLGPTAARGVTVRTFHSLGLAIIGQAEGKRPTLAPSAESDRALFELLKEIIADLLADGGLSGTVLEWFRDQFAPYKSEHEFRNWGEYWNYIRRHDIRSLKGEKVKSYEECEIANYLYLNGIAYEYEASYEHDTATPEKRQYQPDFHLPGAGEVAQGVAGPLPRHPTLRRRRRLAGHLPVRRIRYRRHARVRNVVRLLLAYRPGNHVPDRRPYRGGGDRLRAAQPRADPRDRPSDAQGGPPSSFARELMHGRYDVNVFGRLPQADVPCPQCKEGRLERRENPRSGGTFYGCSNWPYCRLTRPPCPSCGVGLAVRTGDDQRCRDCGELLETCPDCDGWMETSMGRYGRFLGCSNWPDCGYTRNLRQSSKEGPGK